MRLPALALALVCAVCVLGAAAASAEEVCPPAPDHSEAIAGVLSKIQAAETEMAGRALGQQLWEFWTDAPDEAAQGLLDEGMSRRAGFDFLGARATFDRLVAYCPDYAEGWNQRAFASFLMQDYPAALADLDRTLAINPAHVGALAGKALTLMEMGRRAEARAALLAALELNPWLSERALLPRLAPPGEDI